MEELFVQRGFANTPEGQIHYAIAGQGKPVLLLHQTPRSWDEYRDVLPLIGKKYCAIAMDTIGFGDSYKPRREGSIEEYARGVIRFLDAMAIARTSLVGHHTGGVIAVEVAASFPERVDKLVLSSTPYVDAEDRERRRNQSPIDEVEFKEDGTHLTELWQKRMAFYPENRPDLLKRFIIDAIKVLERVEEGHRAVSRYKMEEKVDLIKAPTLVLGGTDDPFSFPRMRPLSDSIKGSRTETIEGGMVPMVDQMPEEFARVVMEFLGKEQR
ncbi:MAG: alpha/beta hydrolase [Deltaproteobacteria bacterium]|nr:alpha/beta hydrolase [Deltaproteobacteria bacterium]MBW2078588.1 alpha/beta hydrolase [Deltaproteobacteria bacterium]